MKYAFLDTEIIGTNSPKFLIVVKIDKQHHSFWLHKRGDLQRFKQLLPNYTFVTFNGENFDRPLIAAALMGYDEVAIKHLAEVIITEEMNSWRTYNDFALDFVNYDHIDIMNVAPGVLVSLKRYAGRMHHPTMIDMPFSHTHDLKSSELPTVEQYCRNDVDVTEALFKQLKVEIELRKEMSAEYEIDLRSKSDAQIAEAILKSKCGLTSKDKRVPSTVTYKAPKFIKTRNTQLNKLIKALEQHEFQINPNNGSPEFPDFLADPIKLGFGTYQLGIGGLHSTHDNNMYLEASEILCLSDFDVASYYPNIMIKAGFVPDLKGKGAKFLEEYSKIYHQRMEAKHAGNKKVANSLKITLNGTFGKLGNIYCSFYSPDLMLAVTITGQLNLLCLIHELEKIPNVQVRSANTDGILLAYPPSAREAILNIFKENVKRTGFEYEETPYLKYAAKDVNNYLAVKTKGGIKRKGLYAVAGVQEMKNPTMEVCSNAVAQFLLDGTPVEAFVKKAKDIRDFVAIRDVKGGGVQHPRTEMRDDWEQVDGGWAYPGQKTKPVKRKSRPPPREVGIDGKPFGRIARWYMTTEQLPPITYVGSGNTVPLTTGAKLCLTLPKTLPKDLNKDWYVAHAQQILCDIGLLNTP
jgi:hypothetical protein